MDPETRRRAEIAAACVLFALVLSLIILVVSLVRLGEGLPKFLMWGIVAMSFCSGSFSFLALFTLWRAGIWR